MPKENKIPRGRREKKTHKRKRDDDDADKTLHKRRKPQDGEEEDVEFIGRDNVLNAENGAEEDIEAASRPFYGMLEDEEQEYFRRADEMLEINDFPSPEDRDLFLRSVYREAEGKELKIACSQSCSRLMERLILLSTVEQKKKLFQNFSGNFPHLVQHRFASHCCEMLFIQSAPVVTQELTADSAEGNQAETVDGEVYVSMENLFLYTLNELEGQISSLLTHRFASHTLRVLLIVLAGRALESSATRSLLRSRKKERITISGLPSASADLTLSKRAVPESFTFAVEKIISDVIATMETSFIRVLATHPTGNPSLQLLLELELSNPQSKKGGNASQQTLISALLPDDPSVEDSESAVFVNGILYDPIGSRLLETIMTFAPGKLFKQIYRTTFKDRIAALARNEIASYVVIKVLNRISKEDLEEAVISIVPQVTGLVSRSRTVVLKTLLQRCHARGAIPSISALTAAISSAYGDDSTNIVLKMAGVDDIQSFSASVLPPIGSTSNEDPKPKSLQLPKSTAAQLHGSLLAQTMLSIPGPPSELIQASLLALPSDTLLVLALFTTTSHIIQAALSTASTPTPFRRKLLNTLLFPSPSSDISPTPPSPPPLTLALSPSGAHTLDTALLSSGTLFSLIERLATTLSAHEPALRESHTGRIIWRNLHLDLFKRRRGDWVKKIKEAGVASSVPSFESQIPVSHANDHSIPGSSSVHPPQNINPGSKKSSTSHNHRTLYPASKNSHETYTAAATAAAPPSTKTAIQLAREKFAVEKSRRGAEFAQGKGKGRDKGTANSKGTGVNAIVT